MAGRLLVSSHRGSTVGRASRWDVRIGSSRSRVVGRTCVRDTGSPAPVVGGDGGQRRHALECACVVVDVACCHCATCRACALVLGRTRSLCSPPLSRRLPLLCLPIPVEPPLRPRPPRRWSSASSAPSANTSRTRRCPGASTLSWVTRRRPRVWPPSRQQRRLCARLALDFLFVWFLRPRTLRRRTFTPVGTQRVTGGTRDGPRWTLPNH